MSYFVEIQLGPLRVRALVDSGASCSVLSSAVVNKAEHLRLQCRSTRKTVKGVGNLEIPIHSTVFTSVGIGSLKTYLRFAVVEASSLPVDAILGNNFLHPMGAIIEMGSGYLCIHNKRIKMEGKYSNKPSGCLAIAGESCVIPARTKAIVKVKISGQARESRGELGDDPQNTLQVMIEPMEEAGLEPGLFVGRSLSNEKEGTALAVIMNTTNVPATIDRNTQVGYSYPVAPIAAKEATGWSVEEGYQLAVLENDSPCKEDEPTGKRAPPAEMFDLSHVREGKEELIELLNAYPEVVSYSAYDIGRCAVPPLTIDTGSAEPIRMPMRRMGPIQAQQCAKHIKLMKNAGILQHSSSDWSSNLVPVTKRDGEIRPCVDLRFVNSVTKFLALPLPSVDETLRSLKGSKVFTTLDCVKGFHQLPLSPRSGEKTAFAFQGELLEYKRVAFGLKNAAGHFQCTMQLVVITGLSPEECLVYVAL